MLSAAVQIGNAKLMQRGQCDRSTTFSSLRHSGYDSVRITGGSGDEIVVYNYDQVANIRVLPG